MTDETSRAAEWRRVPSMPGYEASNLGEIRKDGKLVRQYNDRGYRLVCQNRKNVLSHRIVAEAFGLDMTHFIDHIDRNRSNNNITNLRSATLRQNTAWAYGRDPEDAGIFKYFKRFKARLGHKGKRIYVGSFSTMEEARAALTIRRKELGYD